LCWLQSKDPTRWPLVFLQMAKSDDESLAGFSAQDDGASDGKGEDAEQSDASCSQGARKRGRGRAKAKAKAPAKKQRAASSKAAGRPTSAKAGNRVCGECGATKPLADFKPGNAVCTNPCLRMKDCLYKACKHEDCLEWYEEQKRDPAKWKKLKRWYQLRCAGTLPGKKPKTFSPLQYQTHVRSEQQQLRDGVLEMMHEAAFIHWASKGKNWPPRGLSEQDAKTEFQRRCQDPDTIVDFAGPNAAYRQRVAVATRTVITNRDLFARGQGYTMQDKVIKKATQADVDKAYQRVHTNLEDAAGATNQMSQTDMHRFLAKGSTGGEDGEAASAFEGTLARLGGIKGLAADAEAACEEDADAKSDQEHGEASDGNASEPEPGSGRKRKSSNRSNPSSDGRKPKVPKLWVEKELKVAAATRAQQAWRKDMISTLSSLHKDVLALGAVAEDKGIQETVQTELKVAKLRSHACALVLGLADITKTADNQPRKESLPAVPATAAKDKQAEGDKDKTDPEKKISDAATPAEDGKNPEGNGEPKTEDARSIAATSFAGLSPEQIADKKAARALQVFLAGFLHGKVVPPCRSYRSLLTMNDFIAYFGKFAAAECEADIKTVLDEMKPFKQALNDLVSMTRNAVTALKNAMKQAQGKNNDKGKQASQASGLTALFERGVEKGSGLPIMDIGAGATPLTSLAEPMLVTGLFNGVDADGPLWAAIKSFKPKFENSKLRTSEGRAERLVKGDSLTAAMSVADKVVLPTKCLNPKSMHAELHPATFAIVKGAETVSCERGRGPSLRLQFEGTRQIVCADTEDIKKFMAKNGISSVAPEAAIAFFKGMTKEVIDAYLSANFKLFHGTVSPKDAVLIPFNWIFAEKCQRDNDTIGLRISFWLAEDESKMSEVSRWLISMKKPNAWLQNALEALMIQNAD